MYKKAFLLFILMLVSIVVKPQADSCQYIQALIQQQSSDTARKSSGPVHRFKFPVLHFKFPVFRFNSPAQYVSVSVGGGLQSLSYSLSNGKHSGGAGIALNANYVYALNPNWGLETGIGFSTYSTTAKLNYYAEKTDVDTDGDTYVYRTHYKGWTEKQSMLRLTVPLGANYRYYINVKWTAIVSSGLEFSFPLQSRYKVTDGSIITTGYYSKWNVELSDMPQHGFTTVTHKYSGTIKLNPECSVYLNMAACYRFNDVIDLMAGCYFNYGLNNMIKTTQNEVYQKEGTYHNILNSNQVNNVNSIAIGIKCGVLWRIPTQKK
jgi:OmpA-OmpF porin, OOP family